MVRRVISKSDLMKWWLILDLTSPEGGSVNDGINRECCSLCYLSVDEVVLVCTVVRWARGQWWQSWPEGGKQECSCPSRWPLAAGYGLEGPSVVDS